MAEIRRVLAPGGRLWVVDMVEQPVRMRELPVLARSAVAHLRTRRARPQFAHDLAALTDAPGLGEHAAAQPNPRRARVPLVFRQPVPRHEAGDADGDHVGTSGGIRFGTPGQGADRPTLLPVMTMHPNSCLGIVDWGIGGVGLVSALDRLAPGLPVLYWSDAGATPYGRMGVDELADRLMHVVAALAERGATEVVLACNAASTVVGRLGCGAGPGRGNHQPRAGLRSRELAVRSASSADGAPSTRGTTGADWPGRERGVVPSGAAVIRAHRGRSHRLSAVSSPTWPRSLRRCVGWMPWCWPAPTTPPRAAGSRPRCRTRSWSTRPSIWPPRSPSRYPEARSAASSASRVFLTTGDPDAMRRGAARAWGTMLTATAIRPQHRRALAS